MTATISETDLDMSVLDRLEFKPSLACENVTQAGVACDKEAEWIVRHKCCDMTKLFCTFHKELLVTLLGRWKVNHNAQYGGCGKQIEVLSIERI